MYTEESALLAERCSDWYEGLSGEEMANTISEEIRSRSSAAPLATAGKAKETESETAKEAWEVWNMTGPDSTAWDELDDGDRLRWVRAINKARLLSSDTEAKGETFEEWWKQHSGLLLPKHSIIEYNARAAWHASAAAKDARIEAIRSILFETVDAWPADIEGHRAAILKAYDAALGERGKP